MRSITAAVMVSLALSVCGLSEVHAGASTDGPAHGAGGLERLRADARGSVRVTPGVDGTARVVSLSRGAIDPTVTRATGPRAAAQAHLQRYAAAVGADDPGTRLVAGAVTRAVTGHDVVRFTQQRDGLPVIGGAVAVDLRPDRQLGGMTASVSRATVPGAAYSSEDARRVALATESRRLVGVAGTSLTAGSPQHMLWDPAVFGVRRTADPATHARGVWWVDVRAGVGFHRVVLVDDVTGGVVQDLDANEQVDRVVCDNQNFNVFPQVPCTSDFARTEEGPKSAVKDVNDAFRLAGVVSDYYRQIGHLDLTQLIGVDEGDHQSLSSTVRYCDSFRPPSDCPLQNAFWNGAAMFYGDGYASADDVVGHEMTHGVISHNADLFYWGQSGAINESLADVMGEIIDHRHRGPGDSRHSWTLGEDLPFGAIRSMKKPGRFGQPDSMTSKKYARGSDLDNGGVHTNSGVGNRAFYLISQGGRQDGQSVHGIDGKSLRKTATLHLDAIQHLVSGSDYADLAAVLDSSCRALARHHTKGFTRADCRNVHRATLATHMRTTPPKAKQPPDAPMSCPKGTGPVRRLFDSETGSPAAKAEAGTTWLRAPDSTVFPAVTANATSGHRSWYSSEPQDTTVSSLTLHPVALPAGRPAYLWFQGWYLLETSHAGAKLYYDGATVEVADATRGKSPKPAGRLHWVNGPRHTIVEGLGNPAGGRRAFGGDSRGYVASRAQLTRYAGHAVSPQFTMNVDDVNPDLGWYLDDIRVYTCGRGPIPKSAPQVQGDPSVGSTLHAAAGGWSPASAEFRLHWYADGDRIAGATGTTYDVRGADLGKRISVKVTARAAGRRTSTFSPSTDPVTA